jgi:hypothetical protein
MLGAKRIGKLWLCQSKFFNMLFVMEKMIGYMLTWTTYGSWLQGDKRGYVKDGQVLYGNRKLREENTRNLQGKTVRLTKSQCEIVRKAIQREASEMGQKIYALAVCPFHVHIVVDCIQEPIEKAVGRYKRAAILLLKENGCAGKVWTRGYDKRYCYDKESLDKRIGYVKPHNR